MSTDLQLILNAEEPLLSQRRVRSLSSRYTIDLSPMVVGETYATTIYLIGPRDNYRAESGASGYEPRILIGREGEPFVQIEPEDFAQIANGWSVAIPLRTTKLREAASKESIELSFEFHLTAPDGSERVWFRGAVRVLPALYDPSEDLPEPITDYPTFAQMLRGNVRNVPAVTKLTGGGASALDGLATLDGAAAAGDKVLVYLPATKDLLLYEGVAALAASETAYAIKPDDQPSAFHWKLVAHLGRDGRPAIYNSDQAAYHQLVALGAAGLETLALTSAFTIPLT